METTPVANAPKNERTQYAHDGFSSGSSSDGTLIVEVVMPRPDSPLTAKRAKPSVSIANDRVKRAKCVVGSPASRIINQMAMSPQLQKMGSSAVGSPSTRMRTSGPATTRNARASRTNKKPRKLKSIHWKDFEPIYRNGEIVHAKCIHCHEYLSGKKGIGTSHLGRHLDRCKARCKVNVMVDKLHAAANSTDLDKLEDWVYDYESTREALVRMIVLHELPFSIVEYVGFRDFLSRLNLMFKMVSRTTIRLDCITYFQQEKLNWIEKLKNNNSKVSLTVDMWTSNQTLGYLCVTAHFITKDWKIKKLIIKFLIMESPHNTQSMFNVILKFIQEWNIEDKIFSITLDNAQVNNSMIDLLKPNLLLKKMLPCEGWLFHVRCTAHVINLVVQDGLKQIREIVNNIRESVKYIRSSQSRKKKFEKIVVQVGIAVGKHPTIDVSSRWNSTYLMLESAYPLRLAFDELGRQDKNFQKAPTKDEWDRFVLVCNILKTFYQATKVVSGSSYPTANLAFHELWKIKLALDKESGTKDVVIAAMVRDMKKKFRQYWNISFLYLSIPVILDPRFKYTFVDFRLKQAFVADAAEHLDTVRRMLRKLFNEYSCQMKHPNIEFTDGTSNDEVGTTNDDSFADWDQHQKEVVMTQASNELDNYLEEKLVPRTDDFDVLGWWKANCTKWPVLSCMARDVLTIPALTVASESAFSTGERVVSDFRSRLSTEAVEALICLQDWLRAAAPCPEKITLQVVA